MFRVVMNPHFLRQLQLEIGTSAHELIYIDNTRFLFDKSKGFDAQVLAVGFHEEYLTNSLACPYKPIILCKIR